ncbi:hypothetical protein [Alicyclobacillus fastidiosus]|uniref:ABC transporter permease n=1 Tax=Alicyclobacillus fastidiosus TaxID=392011 RepID=A0ABV5AJB8_9BACL|nr:hypothetical protein [Alicyclobacillus fastidiosus]WEH08382.1 hypothetical protein PYS47_17025 [Alicyclobacillus fastidiosus]
MNSYRVKQSDVHRWNMFYHGVRALLLRDWIVMRTWLFSLTLVVLAGPIINLLNAIGAPSSIRLASTFESIYTTSLMSMGTIDSVNHQIMAIGFRPHVPILIQGYPPASLWVIGVATIIGALLATFDKQTLAITDTFNAPVHRNEWISEKLLFGTVFIVVMVVLRTMVLWVLNILSPFHFSISTLCFSGMVNVLVALTTFVVVFFTGLLVGNVLLGWALGFSALAFPLTIGAVIRFLGVIPGFDQATYNLEHYVVLKLSPLWYTDYSTNLVQHLSTQAQHSVGLTPITNITMYTAVSHPWWLAIGAFIICIISYVCSIWVFARTKAEHFNDLFISSRTMHSCLTCFSLMFGSIAAQVLGRVYIPAFLSAGVLCYVVLGWVYRKLEAISISRERREYAHDNGSPS